MCVVVVVVVVHILLCLSFVVVSSSSSRFSSSSDEGGPGSTVRVGDITTTPSFSFSSTLVVPLFYSIILSSFL